MYFFYCSKKNGAQGEAKLLSGEFKALDVYPSTIQQQQPTFMRTQWLSSSELEWHFVRSNTAGVTGKQTAELILSDNLPPNICLQQPPLHSSNDSWTRLASSLTALWPAETRALSRTLCCYEGGHELFIFLTHKHTLFRVSFHCHSVYSFILCMCTYMYIKEMLKYSLLT